MDTVQRIAHNAVFRPVALYNLQQIATFAVRNILQRHLFAVLRNGLIDRLKHGHKLFDKGCTLLVNLCSVLCHLHFQEF